MRFTAYTWLAAALMIGSAAPARAQTGATSSRSSAPRFDLEMYGGLSLGRQSSGGSLELPGPGAPIATSSPTFPSWRVPTWFLGDGALFINRVAQEFGTAARIAPLDGSLDPAALSDAGNFSFGARLRYPLRGRFSLEGGVDVMLSGGQVTQALLDAAAAARDSFQSVFGQILATGPFTGTVVSAATSHKDGASREIALTGALVTSFSPWGSFSPYLVTGGGVLVHGGQAPAVQLDGAYSFRIEGVTPINETDRLVVEYGEGTAFVGLVGGGLERNLSPRWRLRFDARVLIGPRTTQVALHADPSVTTATPAGFIETFTYPNLQFSNNPSTNRESTLSGSLDGFDAFQGGWQARYRFTVGAVVRF